MFITLTLYFNIFPLLLSSKSAVPVALVSLGGTSSLPVSFAINLLLPCVVVVVANTDLVDGAMTIINERVATMHIATAFLLKLFIIISFVSPWQ
jgi:hypothetical protein